MSNFSNWIALFALLVSVGSLLFTLYRNSSIGQVQTIEPSGYAVIRGLTREQGIGPFPSDHLVLPMQWKNASGRPVVIQRPELILHKLSEGKETGEKTIYSLAGKYPDISTESFSTRYIHNNSLLVEPHSVSLNTLVFHHKDYWNEKGRHFKFTAYDEYRVDITYTKSSGLGIVSQMLLRRYADGQKTEVLAESFKVHGKVDKLYASGEGEPWWDYYEDITF